MILGAYMATAQQLVAVEPTGDFRRDFRLLLSRFAANLATPLGAALMRIALAVRGTDAQVHFRRFLRKRFEQLEPIFQTAIQSGQLADDVDWAEILERSAGAAIFRLFIDGREVDEPWLDRMVADVATIYGRKTAGPKVDEASETAS